ncbi:MAG: amidohydrolase [Acidobacteriia bacterium]|nr:amidohydrolase [Terriglobia bacterium]
MRIFRFAFLALPLMAQFPDQARLLQRMDDLAPHYGAIASQIWELAESGYQEHKSSALLKAELRKAGFALQENVGGIPTAFAATWGQGKPVVGIMGEFDALPGLSQATLPDRMPIVEGAPGHGCGHNLLGTAAVFAAIVAKDQFAASGRPGTIRFFGTPAEEGGGGKIYMARAGVFSGTDVVLTWHPGNNNSAGLSGTLANISAKFRFHGKASHASSAPEAGRSALDAVQLMNYAVELLREHVPQETRIHYVITNGGSAPNIVPQLAESYYYARHPNMTSLDGIWDRIVKCAQAAALATETRMEMDLVNSVYDVLPNDALSLLLDKNLRRAGGVQYTAEENAFARRLQTTLDNPSALGTQESIVPREADRGLGGSTDVGDISWLLPTAQFTTATWVPGTPAHTWQSTACSGMSIGRKGMLVAAKTLALTTLDILHDPKQGDQAQASFEKRKGGRIYRSRVPEGQNPLSTTARNSYS